MLHLRRNLGCNIVNLITVCLSLLLSFHSIFIVLHFEEAAKGIGFPLKLGKISTSISQLDIELGLRFLTNICFNFIFNSLKYIAISHIVGNISQGDEVASAEPHKQALLLFVCILIQHRSEVWYLIVSTSSSGHYILRYLCLLCIFKLIN
jgi:hypothetical protein